MKDHAYTIKQASDLSGISAKMIRHYEKIGLLPAPERTASGYRLFDSEAIHTLGFIRRSRELGFSMKQIEELLALWRDKDRSSAEVKKIAQGHLDQLEAKLQEIEEMASALRHLVKNCHGDQRPDCPIIENLES